MITPKNRTKTGKKPLCDLPPNSQKFSNAKIDKSISALKIANFIKIFGTPLKGVLMIQF